MSPRSSPKGLDFGTLQRAVMIRHSNWHPTPQVRGPVFHNSRCGAHLQASARRKTGVQVQIYPVLLHACCKRLYIFPVTSNAESGVPSKGTSSSFSFLKRLLVRRSPVHDQDGSRIFQGGDRHDVLVCLHRDPQHSFVYMFPLRHSTSRWCSRRKSPRPVLPLRKKRLSSILSLNH